GPGGGMLGGPGGTGGTGGHGGGMKGPGGMGGMMGGRGMAGTGGMVGGQGTVASSDTLKVLEVVTLKDFLDPEKNKGFVPAQFVVPMQAVIVHASFPWKQQLKEFETALRKESLSELMNSPNDLPH